MRTVDFRVKKHDGVWNSPGYFSAFDEAAKSIAKLTDPVPCLKYLFVLILLGGIGSSVERYEPFLMQLWRIRKQATVTNGGRPSGGPPLGFSGPG
jgi:hypothetical protein